MAITFVLITRDIQSGCETLAYVSMQIKWSHRILSYNPIQREYTMGTEPLDKFISFMKFFGQIVYLVLSIARLIFPFLVEFMIIIQIFQVGAEKGSNVSVQDQVADFLVLIIILEIDNFLADIPIYSTLKSSY